MALFGKGARQELNGSVIDLANRIKSPAARRPATSGMATPDPRAERKIEEVIGEYLDGMRLFSEIQSDSEALFLATEALALMDHPRAAEIAVHKMEAHLLWYGYLTDHLRRPDLMAGQGGVSAADAILGTAVALWRRELVASWFPGQEQAGLTEELIGRRLRV